MTSCPQVIKRLPLPLIGLILVLVPAAYLRLYNLIPPDRGILFLQDYDEAVWATTAQLMLQGHLPYLEFFATLPPVAIYLLAGVLRLVDIPWGSAAGLMATRYASVAYGLATVVTVYLLGHKLSGWPTGLTAAGLLALDGMVISMDRRVMLEPPLNLFSVLAMLTYCIVIQKGLLDRRAQWTAILTGILCALASLSKTQGLLVVLAVLTVSLLRRQFREAALIGLGFALSWLVLSAYFLLRCPEELLKQVYLFQLLRPADGITRWTTRLYDIWHYQPAWLTVRAGLAGALFVTLLVIAHRASRAWSVILAWLGYTLGLIVLNKSYWPQYYVQLAVPMCLVGGGLLDRGVWPAWPAPGASGRFCHITVGTLTLAALLVAGLSMGALSEQWRANVHLIEEISPTYTEIAGYLRQNTAPGTRVLAFEPNYTFLASRPPGGHQPSQFLVDSYGEMLYVNLGIAERSLPALMQSALAGEASTLQSVFWRRPAQDDVLAAFDQAQYVIVDGRARYQLLPETLAEIQARSEEVLASDAASLRQRRGD